MRSFFLNSIDLSYKGDSSFFQTLQKSHFLFSRVSHPDIDGQGLKNRI